MDSENEALDGGCRAYLPSASPRYLFDRGLSTINPRLEVGKPLGSCARKACVGGRGRDGSRWGVQSPRRRSADLRWRRWNRSLPTYFPQTRRSTLGVGTSRDTADPFGERLEGSDRRTGGWPIEDRKGRGHRCTSWRRGVRICDRSPGGFRMRDDAGMSPRYLPSRYSNAEPRASKALFG